MAEIKSEPARTSIFKPPILNLPYHPSPQGDAILQCEHVFEVATKLAMLIKKEHAVRVVQGR